jgi:hypothetical protein
MEMTTLNTDIENTRILSILSEKVHFVTQDNKEYMCFGGVVCPKALGNAVALWAITGSKRYRNLFRSNQDLNEIFDLNQKDPWLSKADISQDIEWYLIKTMRQCMKTWDPTHFEDLFA